MSEWEIPPRQVPHASVQPPLKKTPIGNVPVQPQPTLGTNVPPTQQQVSEVVPEIGPTPARQDTAPQPTVDGPQLQNQTGSAQLPQPSSSAFGAGSPSALRDGRRQEVEPEIVSPVRLAEAYRELSQAKGAFTRLKNKAFANSGEYLHLLSEEELVNLKQQLAGAYGRLCSVFSRVRSLTEAMEELVKLDEGFAPYEHDNDVINRCLQEEIDAKRAIKRAADDQARLARKIARNEGSLVDVGEDSSAADFPGYESDGTPFRTVNQTNQGPTGHTNLDLLSSPGQVDQSRVSRVDLVQQQTLVGMGADQSSTSQVGTPAVVDRGRGRKKKKDKSQKRSRGVEHGPGGQSSQGFQVSFSRTPFGLSVNRETRAGVDRTVQVDHLQVVPLVQAATAAGWDTQRVQDAVASFYQTGVYPSELRSVELQATVQDRPRASTAMGMGSGDVSSDLVRPSAFRPRRLASDLVQNPPPLFVTGANALPLGSTGQADRGTFGSVQPSSNPIQSSTGPIMAAHTSQVQGFAQVPRVPMPGTQTQGQGPGGVPQLPQGTNAPTQTGPVQGFGPVQNQSTHVLPPMLRQQLAYPGQVPSQPQGVGQPGPYLPNLQVPPPVGANFNQNVLRPSGPAQPSAQSSFPPPVGIFGNHSFDHGHRAPFAGQRMDLSHWTYDPYNYRQKPLMKVNNVVFDGTPNSCSFEEFKATFEVVCGARNMPEAQKLVCLKQSLQGDPLKLFSNVVGPDMAPGSLERVIRTLESHYGGHQRLMNSYINRLTQYPVLRRFDCSSLLDLLTLVEEIYHRYEASDPGFLEREGVMLTHIRRIIPEDERVLYYSKLAEYQRRDTFLTLRDFLNSRYESLRLAAIANAGLSLRHSTNSVEEDLGVGLRSAERSQQDAEDREILLASRESEAFAKARELSKTTAQSIENRSSPPSRESGAVNYACSFCSKDHPIWRCADFKMLDVRLRYEHVREKKLCFHCLLPNHRVKDCKYRPDLVCGLEGCKRKHHRLVHNYTDTGLCTIEVFLCETAQVGQVDVECQRQDSLSVHALATNEDQKVPLPLEEEYIAIRTVTVEISCGGSKKRVLAALDSCSNNTNIDEALAVEMGLPVVRSGIPREMHFLERKAHITSDFVQFMLAPLGTDKTYDVHGFTVKNLMSGTPVVDWSQAVDAYPHLRGADIPRPKCGDRIQILLGVEYAELMTPYKVL